MGDWRHRASCRGMDPESFFPVSEYGPGARQVAHVKRVCAGCPVREACLRYALTAGLDFGVFGGLTERERRGLRRARVSA